MPSPSQALSTKRRSVSSKKFLAMLGEDRKSLSVFRKQAVFASGDAADAVFYIQRGKIRLTAALGAGVEAPLAVLGKRHFFGEAALAGQLRRSGSAVAVTDCEILRIEKKDMLDILRREQAFVDMFVSYMLAQTMRAEKDLLDQLFNSSEKKLARILLLLARVGKEGAQKPAIQEVSQETLAEMVGTTRSRVRAFLNRFQRLGFIDYSGDTRGLQVHSSLLTAVLRD